jgi:hypothetical protein
VGQRHHVTVADSPDLHDLHRTQYTRVYTVIRSIRPRRWGSLEGDGWVNWSGLATLEVRLSDGSAGSDV